MTNGEKAVIAGGFTILVAGAIAYYFLVYKKTDGGSGDPTKDDGTNTGDNTVLSSVENFNAVKVNLGNVKADKSGVVVVPFNVNKNTAQFYNNNRIMIFEKNGGSPSMRGNYSDGGKKIVIDGGETVSGSSVWKNLNLLVR